MENGFLGLLMSEVGLKAMKDGFILVFTPFSLRRGSELILKLKNPSHSLTENVCNEVEEWSSLFTLLPLPYVLPLGFMDGQCMFRLNGRDDATLTLSEMGPKSVFPLLSTLLASAGCLADSTGCSADSAGYRCMERAPITVGVPAGCANVEATQNMTRSLGVLIVLVLVHYSGKFPASIPQSFDHDFEIGRLRYCQIKMSPVFVSEMEECGDLETEQDDLSGSIEQVYVCRRQVVLFDSKGKVDEVKVEDEVERFKRICELPGNVSFKRLERKEGSLDGEEGEIVVHIASLKAAYKELASIDALKGLFGLHCIGLIGQFYTYMNNIVYCGIPYKGFSCKWLFVGEDWEGVPKAGSICRVPKSLVKAEWPTIPMAVVSSTELASKARLVGAGLWALGQEPEWCLPMVESSSSDLALSTTFLFLWA
ncbi:hypothetical protein FNV43_RR04543 [Rhamnella rubrinervis]|uniref:Uncharacterized protein n=1 Tax=Rhamnella rubrinervis TaxID=2594499 RepID=A0A8K0HJQ8_9ROSA|nr:hypothetical protein FNV43_RR04543 [Rhamnella rubrinervis]